MENEQKANQSNQAEQLLKSLSTGMYCPFKNGTCVKTCSFFDKEIGFCILFLAARAAIAQSIIVEEKYRLYLKENYEDELEENSEEDENSESDNSELNDEDENENNTNNEE
jgi:hypothetical protein